MLKVFLTLLLLAISCSESSFRDDGAGLSAESENDEANGDSADVPLAVNGSLYLFECKSEKVSNTASEIDFDCGVKNKSSNERISISKNFAEDPAPKIRVDSPVELEVTQTQSSDNSWGLKVKNKNKYISIDKVIEASEFFLTVSLANTNDNFTFRGIIETNFEQGLESTFCKDKIIFNLFALKSSPTSLNDLLKQKADYAAKIVEDEGLESTASGFEDFYCMKTLSLEADNEYKPFEGSYADRTYKENFALLTQRQFYAEVDGTYYFKVAAPDGHYLKIKDNVIKLW